MIEFGKVDDLSGEKKRELLEARIAKQEAITDYIAMMADVEIPEGGDGADGRVEAE